ncbi:MAG TPA: hypothetical protein PKE45_15890, partial [Caldilineaceae bacterium]|nr:hypothetical protein [Caldilineaceae bacterium]
HWGPLAAVLISTVFNCSLWLIKRKGQGWKKSGVQLAFNHGMHALAFLIGGGTLIFVHHLLGEMSILGMT